MKHSFLREFQSAYEFDLCKPLLQLYSHPAMPKYSQNLTNLESPNFIKCFRLYFGAKTT